MRSEFVKNCENRWFILPLVVDVIFTGWRKQNQFSEASCRLYQTLTTDRPNFAGVCSLMPSSLVSRWRLNILMIHVIGRNWYSLISAINTCGAVTIDPDSWMLRQTFDGFISHISVMMWCRLAVSRNAAGRFIAHRFISAPVFRSCCPPFVASSF